MRPPGDQHYAMSYDPKNTGIRITRRKKNVKPTDRPKLESFIRKTNA